MGVAMDQARPTDGFLAREIGAILSPERVRVGEAMGKAMRAKSGASGRFRRARRGLGLGLRARSGDMDRCRLLLLLMIVILILILLLPRPLLYGGKLLFKLLHCFSCLDCKVDIFF